MKVTCDDCKKEFKLTQNKIKFREVINDVTEQYFICPRCKKKYTIAYFDTEINENIKRMKELKNELDNKEITVEEYYTKTTNLKNRNVEKSNRYKLIYKTI